MKTNNQLLNKNAGVVIVHLGPGVLQFESRMQSPVLQMQYLFKFFVK